jgi:hypothetical protein
MRSWHKEAFTPVVAPDGKSMSLAFAPEKWWPLSGESRVVVQTTSPFEPTVSIPVRVLDY